MVDTVATDVVLQNDAHPQHQVHGDGVRERARRGHQEHDGLQHEVATPVQAFGV